MLAYQYPLWNGSEGAPLPLITIQVQKIVSGEKRLIVTSNVVINQYRPLKNNNFIYRRTYVGMLLPTGCPCLCLFAIPLRPT